MTFLQHFDLARERHLVVRVTRILSEEDQAAPRTASEVLNELVSEQANRRWRESWNLHGPMRTALGTLALAENAATSTSDETVGTEASDLEAEQDGAVERQLAEMHAEHEAFMATWAQAFWPEPVIETVIASNDDARVQKRCTRSRSEFGPGPRSCCGLRK